MEAQTKRPSTEVFKKVTANTCKNIIVKVVEQEDKYWLEDKM